MKVVYEKESCFLWFHKWGKWHESKREVINKPSRALEVRQCKRCGHQQAKLLNVSL